MSHKGCLHPSWCLAGRSTKLCVNCERMQGAAAEKTPNHHFNGVMPDIASLKAASILHLYDLKRAGHSPRDTEFVITAQNPKLVSTYYAGTLGGSPAGDSVGND